MWMLAVALLHSISHGERCAGGAVRWGGGARFPAAGRGARAPCGCVGGRLTFPGGGTEEPVAPPPLLLAGYHFASSEAAANSVPPVAAWEGKLTRVVFARSALNAVCALVCF